MLTTRKKILFSLFTVGGLLFFLVCIELGFRLFVPSPQTSLVSVVAYDGIEWFQINRGYLDRYFSSSDYLIPEFKQTLFRRRKDPNTFRILCLGESSMFGVPYQMNASIPGIVRKQLRSLYPDKEIEVINFAASAINTNVILDFASELIAFKPDLILLYTGHNEMYGPDGISASFIERQLPFLTPLKYSFRNLRTVSYIRKTLRSRIESEGTTRDITLMKQVSKESRVTLSSVEAQYVLNNFANNLDGIAKIFAQHHIPMIVSDVASNLTFPPFASASEEWKGERRSTFDSALNYYNQTNYPRSKELFSSLLHSDSTDAAVNFYLGMTDLRLGKFGEARKHLAIARDNDLLKFRAPGRINTIIESFCRHHQIPFFSADSLISANSFHGISDTSLFWEHLHPNPKGYYLIANQFVSAINDYHFIGSPKRLLIPFQYDSLAICWLDLAYGDLSMSKLTGKWPFQNYRICQLVYDKANPALKNIVDGLYYKNTVWDLGCYESANYFWREGQWKEAVTTYQAVIEEYPYNFYAHYLLASLLSRMNQLPDAIRHYEISIRSNPQYPYSYVELGLIEINGGAFDEAIRLFTKAEEISRDLNETMLKANILYGLSAAYANKREYQKALTYADRALTAAPGYRDAEILKMTILKIKK